MILNSILSYLKLTLVPILLLASITYADGPLCIDVVTNLMLPQDNLLRKKSEAANDKYFTSTPAEESAVYFIEFLNSSTETILGHFSRGEPVSQSFTQNEIWRYYEMHSQVALYLNPPRGYSAEVISDKLRSALLRAFTAHNKMLVSVNFYKSLEDSGMTLTPGANQTIKLPLPAPIANGLENLKFRLSHLNQSNFNRLSRAESLPWYTKDFSFSADVRAFINNFGRFMLSLNLFLQEIVSTTHPDRHDLVRVVSLNNRVEEILSSEEFKRFLEKNHKSIFKDARRSAEILQQQMTQFSLLSERIRNERTSNLQRVE